MNHTSDAVLRNGSQRPTQDSSKAKPPVIALSGRETTITIYDGRRLAAVVVEEGIMRTEIRLVLK